MGFKQLFFLINTFMLLSACSKSETIPEDEDRSNTLIVKSEVVTPSFVGNGVQWGGYDLLEAWTGSPSLSDADWETLFRRVRFMRPPLVRIMVAPGWNYLVDHQFYPEKSKDVLLRILDFCQQEQITVMFGEWGHTGGEQIDADWLENSVNFVDWLMNTKGYSCIRYFNMVNEPNGDWSTINGNYNLWKSLIELFHEKLIAKGLDSQLKIIGPDVAIWDNSFISWVRSAHNDLSEQITAFDIHTYPSETIVRSGDYLELVTNYRSAAPASSEMLMGELGFKYAASSELGTQNAQRIANDKYASDDSNMFVYDAFYGIDMADAVIQNMMAGYAGNILWDMDDAMYNVEGLQLKRWGFWNILGTETFENPEDENIRPWFYPMSLLCRYFPRGTTIRAVELPDKYGLRAIAGEKDGKYTIALVNSHTVSYSIHLQLEDAVLLSNLKRYEYQAQDGASFDGDTDSSGFPTPVDERLTLHFQEENKEPLEVPAKSFILITNID